MNDTFQENFTNHPGWGGNAQSVKCLITDGMNNWYGNNWEWNNWYGNNWGV
jgi:hypothetical protein